MKTIFSALFGFLFLLTSAGFGQSHITLMEEKKTIPLIPMHKKTISKSTGDIPNHHVEPRQYYFSPATHTHLKKDKDTTKKVILNPYLPVLPLNKCFEFEGERSQTVTFYEVTPEALRSFHEQTNAVGQYTRSYGAILSIILVLQANRFAADPISTPLNLNHWEEFKDYTDVQKRRIAAHHFTITLNEVLEELEHSQSPLIETFAINLANFNQQFENRFITTAQALEYLEEQHQDMSTPPSVILAHTTQAHHSHAVSEPILQHMSAKKESNEQRIIRKNDEFNERFNILFENCGDVLTGVALKIGEQILKKYQVNIPTDPAEQDRLSAEALQQRLAHVTTCQ